MKPCGKAQCRFFHDGRCYQLLPHGDSQPVTEGLMCDYSPLPHLQVPINETFLAHISSYDYRYPDNSYNDPYHYYLTWSGLPRYSPIRKLSIH